MMLYPVLLLFFSLGYLSIIFEKFLHINKAAIALFMGAICWLIIFIFSPGGEAHAMLGEHLSEIAQIIFFLLAAMVIVELIDSHHGFKVITDVLQATSPRRMYWLLVVISFFMSAVLDNLTTMIVMVSLLKKLIPERHDRWLMGSLLVISVNAGGAWTPIGDVTTTMLWINGKITTFEVIKSLFVPSVVCITCSALLGLPFFHGKKKGHVSSAVAMAPGARRVLCLGVGSLIMVPVWKALFGLPPFVGALIGLGALWLITDITHYRHGEERWHLRVSYALTKIDSAGILFFLGILLAIDSLTTAGILKDFALWLHQIVPSQSWIAVIIGLISSVIDNVPLVAATIGMYDSATYPTDSQLWQMIAYAAGTGGSILIIGSAAGVAFMGLEKVDFIWYLKYVSWIALVGYFAGFGAYALLYSLF